MFCSCSILLCSYEWSPLYCIELGLEKLVGTDLFSYYTAQLSLTFISISVMSVLSDKSVIIYWENVAESKLIKPVYGCFAAFTCYSIVSNIGSALGVFLSSTTVFTLFFMINIVVLIFLTHAITDVYYGKDKKRQKLVKELKDDFTNIPKNPASLYAYKQKMMGLQQRCFQLRSDSDFSELGLMYELYAKNTEVFSRHEARPFASALVSTLDVQSADQFFFTLSDVSKNVSQFTENLISDIRGTLGTTDTDKDLKTIMQELKDAEHAQDIQLSANEEAALRMFRDPYSTYFQDCMLCKAMSDLNNISVLISEFGESSTAEGAVSELFRLLKHRLLDICNMRIIEICINRGHPEFIDKLLFEFESEYSELVVFRHDKSIEEYELRRELMRTVFGFHPSAPIETVWEFMYKLLHIVAENPELYPSAYFYDLPITDVTANWVYKGDDAVSQIMDNFIQVPKIFTFTF